MCAMRIARIALAVGERRWPSIFSNLDSSTSCLIWHMVASGSSWCWHTGRGFLISCTSVVPTGQLGFIILINDLVVAEILDDRVELDLEPSLEHCEVSAFWPARFVSVPPIEFVLKYRGMHPFENLPRLVVGAVTWDEIDSLLIVRIGHDPRVIQSCRPIQVGLLRPYDHDTTVEHRSTPRDRGARIMSRGGCPCSVN